MSYFTLILPHKFLIVENSWFLSKHDSAGKALIALHHSNRGPFLKVGPIKSFRILALKSPLKPTQVQRLKINSTTMTCLRKFEKERLQIFPFLFTKRANRWRQVMRRNLFYMTDEQLSFPNIIIHMRILTHQGLFYLHVQYTSLTFKTMSQQFSP